MLVYVLKTEANFRKNQGFCSGELARDSVYSFISGCTFCDVEL